MIGRLRHRVEIGKYIMAQDPNTGDMARQWQAVAQVWAAVEGLRGNLLFQSRQTTEQADHRVTIRYRADVEPGMIVRHDGRELTITAALDEEGRRRWLVLTCREVRPA